jgi:hypothetical protein
LAGTDASAFHLNPGDEAIAALGERFDELRICGGVAQGFANLVDRGVETVVEVDESAVGPEGLLDFGAGNEFARAAEQHQQDLKRLALDGEAAALFAELSRFFVGLESTEAVNAPRGVLRHLHPPAPKSLEGHGANREMGDPGTQRWILPGKYLICRH